MTNADLETLYRANADISHGAALRLIFNMAYALGQGVNPATQAAEKADGLSKPTDAQIAGVKQVTKKF